MAVNEGFHLGKFGHTYLTRFQSLQAKRVGIVKVNILYGSIKTILCIECMGDILSVLGIELANDTLFYIKDLFRKTSFLK